MAWPYVGLFGGLQHIHREEETIAQSDQHIDSNLSKLCFCCGYNIKA